MDCEHVKHNMYLCKHLLKSARYTKQAYVTRDCIFTSASADKKKNN